MTKSESNKEARLRSTSRTKSRMSMSPKPRSQRAIEHPPSRKRYGSPAIPLPPLSSPEDRGRNRKIASQASKPIRSVSPRSSGSVRSLSPAPSSLRNRSEPRPPAKTHLLVRSHSKRVRSQSPHVSRGTINSASVGISARSPGGGKKKPLNIAVQHSVPSTPKGKRKSKSVDSKDGFGFEVIWQRSPGGSSGTNKENGKKVRRPASLSPAPTQRRTVGGASMRIRALERKSSRSHKDMEEDWCIRGHRDQRKGQESKHRGSKSSSDQLRIDMPRSQSSGMLGKRGKVPAASKSSHCPPDRFSAAPREADFPPLSPLRRPSTKTALVIPSLPDNLPFQANVGHPRNSNVGVPRHGRQDRRSSCA